MQYFWGLYFTTDPFKDPKLEGNSAKFRPVKVARVLSKIYYISIFFAFCFVTIHNFQFVIISIGVKSVRMVVKFQWFAVMD